MQANKVVNAFKSAMTPDDAATAIQSRVRVKAAQKMVKEKRGGTAPPPRVVVYTKRPAKRPGPVDEWYARRGNGIGSSLGASLGLTPGFTQVLPHAHQLHDEVAALKRQLAKQEEGLRRMASKR